MNKPTTTTSVLLISLLIGGLLCLLLSGVQCLEPGEEPAFPQLLNPERLDQSSIHIVTESMSDTDGRETIEEYVDFIRGKNTFIKAGSMGHSVKHLDAARNIIFHYKPYECFSMTLEELSVGTTEEIWKARTSFRVGKKVQTMHLFGVAAIWLNAGSMAKKFSNSSIIYSASRDIYKSALKWTVEDARTSQEIHLFFIAGKEDVFGKQEMRLEMIQFQSTANNQITRTLNVLEIRYEIDEFARENLLEVPVGYGCIDEQVMQKSRIEYHELSDFKLADLLNTTHRLDLEVSYTNFGPDSLSQPMSQTVNVQLARHKPVDSSGLGFVQLVRQRDTLRDLKTVTHHKLNVEYKIDYRAGTCNMSHVEDEANVNERLLVKFRDDNERDVDGDLFNLQKLFGHNGEQQSEFYFVKQVASSDNIVHQYYETTLDRYGERKIRFVRVYALDEESGDMNLDHVTAYLFNERLDHILVSYQFTLVEVTPLTDLVEIAKLFDVSDECYLSNPEMEPHRDYAWFQVEYPLQARFIAKLTPKVQEVRARLYDALYSATMLTFFRLPKLELLFTETGLTVRGLMIDLPRLHVLFRSKPRSRLSSATRPEVEPDVDRCAELCRLNRCRIMSFCERSHVCSITEDTTRPEIVSVPPEDGCTSYFAPDYYYQEEVGLRLSLQGSLAELQHQDYGQTALPKVPEELLYLDSETDVDPQTRAKMMLEYLSILEKYVTESGRLPSLTFSMTINGLLVILLPSGFEVEEDPMRELNLEAQDEREPPHLDTVQPFHRGLAMRKFARDLLGPAWSDKYRAKLFTGLTYDQCAMACTDSRCSSFSYCEDSTDCLLTDIYELSSLKAATEASLVVEDAHCFIAQRDFLSRFSKFAQVPVMLDGGTVGDLSSATLIRKDVVNPSECAHACVVESNIDCLSFDYCLRGPQKESYCLLYSDRQVHFAPARRTTNSSAQTTGSRVGQQQVSPTTCDHYSRSYLADFVRIEGRRLRQEELERAKTSQLAGASVYQCAERCLEELEDCSGFQLCFQGRQAFLKPGSLQSCVFLESKLATDADAEQASRVLLNESDGRVLETGRLFEADPECQVFALRRDSTQAQVRELALVGAAGLGGPRRGAPDSSTGRANLLGARLFSYGLLYVGLTLVFSTLACALLVAGQRNEYLRHRIERLQILLNM